MKKRKKISQEKIDLGKVLRSVGILFPITEDEVESFERLYGDEPVELPEKLRDPSFLYRDICGE